MAKKQTILEKNPKKITIFLKLVCEGVPPSKAIKMIKVSPSTYFSWMSKGREQDSGVYHEFRKSVLSAETQHLHKCLATLNSALDESPQVAIKSAIWLLENRHKMKQFEQPEIKIINESMNISALISALKESDDLVALKSGPKIDIHEGESSGGESSNGESSGGDDDGK